MNSKPTWEQLLAAVRALAEAGIPIGMQELLLYGDPDRGIQPKALECAIAAALAETVTE